MFTFRMTGTFVRFAVGLLLATCFTALQAAPRVDVVSVDLNPLIDRAAKSPTRFAVEIPHAASPSTAGDWSTFGDVSIWTYSARIPGAVSMSFHASRASLPESATLTVTANGLVMSTRPTIRAPARSGARVLSTEVARTMMSNLLPNGVRANFGMGWGAGGAVLMSSIPTPTPFGMTAGTYGWEGAAGTICWVDRTEGIYALLMAQYMPTEAYNLPSEFSAAVFADHA